MAEERVIKERSQRAYELVHKHVENLRKELTEILGEGAVRIQYREGDQIREIRTIDFNMGSE